MTETRTETYSAEDLEIFDLVKAEYRFYTEDVTNALNDTLLLYDLLPDGLLGDVRDCFGHLCDAVMRTDQTMEKRRSNVTNAHKHLRRAILDCYKLQCIWYREQLRDFDRKYRWSDLSDVDNGEFRPEYTRLKQAATDAFKAAKKAERPGNNDRAEELEQLGDVYTLYEAALAAYSDTQVYLKKSRPAVERVAHRDIRRTVFSVLGWIIGIGMTIAMTVVSILFTRK